MSKWDLGKVSSITMGQSPPSETYNSEKIGLPFFQGKSDFGIMYPSVRIHCDQPQKVAEAGDILISVRAPVGSTNIANQKCCIGRGLAAISALPKITHNKYIFYYLRYCEKKIESMGVGSTFKAISKKDLETIQIPIPPLPIQQKIACLFDLIDFLIAKRRKQIELLDLLVKAQFVGMFGDPVTNPMRWEIKVLSQICENLDSRRIPITSTDRNKGSYPYYGASGIVDYVDDYIFDDDLLLISEDGANLLARVTPIAFSVSGQIWVNNHAHVLKFCEKATQIYVEHYINLINISNYITGTAQPKLNQAQLNLFSIPLPPLPLQTCFADFVKQADKSKFVLQKGVKIWESLQFYIDNQRNML